MARNKILTDKQAEASRRNGKNGGRPKGTLSDQARMQQEMRAMLTRKARDVFDDLVNAQIDLARGVYVEEMVTETSKDGKEVKQKRRVYKRPPSQEAVKYVMDQAIGKPKETKEIDLNDKRALSIDELDAMAKGEIVLMDDDEDDDFIEEDDE
jgi:hypothetical protein